MAKRRVLYISHNHPVNRPGGAEAYAFELHRAMRESDEFEPIFLAKAGPPMSSGATEHSASPFAAVTPDDPNQYFFHTGQGDFDFLFGSARRKELITRHFRDFLLAYRPDVVHFQHTYLLGYELIREVRNTLPHVPILYTLHEYLPICHRNGQMVRTVNEELCLEASPRRCNECFPEIPPERFFLRERFVKSHFALVDLFVAPSRFLRDRYTDWGIEPDRIVFEDYGRLPVTRVADREVDQPRNRLGYFGQVTRYKGVDVLLEAMSVLEAQGSDARLVLHGANLDMQRKDFQEKIQGLLAETSQSVTFAGRYDPDRLPGLLAEVDWVVVPSIWWENSPLVIQEAFLHGRPVICGDIGGMAEKVRHGVDGLHFRARDPLSLADTIRTAIDTPGLWERLRDGVQGAHAMQDHVETLTALYCDLIERRAGVREPAVASAGAQAAWTG